MVMAAIPMQMYVCYFDAIASSDILISKSSYPVYKMIEFNPFKEVDDKYTHTQIQSTNRLKKLTGQLARCVCV